MVEGEPPPASEGVKAFRSYFDAEGYLDWQRCDDGDCDEELGKRYGRIWKGCLNHGILPPPFTDMDEACAPELVRMAAEGIHISSRIAAAAVQNPLPLDELGALGEAETALAARMKLFSALHPENAPLIDFFSLMRDNITSEELPVIAEETRRCYEWARYLASRL
jgi:hypothetical protein